MQTSFRICRRALPFCLLLVGGLACTSFLLNSARSLERGRADLERRTLSLDDHEIVYLAGGRGATLLLLHGFGGDKDNWTRFARYLAEDYRIVAPDLPGFGESTRRPAGDYSYAAQLKRVRAFARGLEIGPVHLVGNSMGGALAGLYAAAYPEDVRSLALFNAAGVKSPDRSEAHRIYEETGVNPLLIQDADDFDRFLNFAFVVPPQMPSSVKRYFAARAVANRPFNDKVFGDLRREPFPLQRRLGRIKAPTLVLWGDTDRIIDISAVKVFRRGLRDERVVVMKDCGHVPMIERPEETARHYRAFLDEIGAPR